MKILNIFFAFYILLLPFFSCSEVDDCNQISKTESANVLASHQNHDEEEDPCSSFCNCACCVQLIVNNPQYKITITKSIDKTKQLFYHNTNSLSTIFIGSIWQPPKYC